LLKERNPQDRPDWSPGVVVVKQFVPVYGARDWWAEKAMDKDFAIYSYYDPGVTDTDLYTVPAGKLLLVAELHLISRITGEIYLRAVTAEYARNVVAIRSDPVLQLAMVFSKPKRITEGETFQLRVVNLGTGDYASFNIGGWEITLE